MIFDFRQHHIFQQVATLWMEDWAKERAATQDPTIPQVAPQAVPQVVPQEAPVPDTAVPDTEAEILWVEPDTAVPDKKPMAAL